MSRRILKRTLVTLAGASLLLATTSASASPPHTRNHGDAHFHRADHGHGHGHGHAQLRGQACRSVYTFGRRGKGKTLVCAPPAHHQAGPWHRAPGNRYRLEHDDHRRIYRYRSAPWHPVAYPPLPARGACNSTILTGAVGGVSGAILGSRIGNGSGRTVATAAGTLIGALAGLGVGESLDRACLGRMLEHAPDGGTVTWNNRRGGPQPWQATPTATWKTVEGRYCREFISTATVGGQLQQVYGYACRQPDGSWEIVS